MTDLEIQEQAEKILQEKSVNYLQNLPHPIIITHAKAFYDGTKWTQEQDKSSTTPQFTTDRVEGSESIKRDLGLKTKLLKKINKRFYWYFNKSKSVVLIDNYLNKVTLINKEFALDYCSIKEKEMVVTEEKLIWNVTKNIIFTSQGFSLSRRRLLFALKTFKRLRERGEKYLSEIEKHS